MYFTLLSPRSSSGAQAHEDVEPGPSADHNLWNNDGFAANSASRSRNTKMKGWGMSAIMA